MSQSSRERRAGREARRRSLGVVEEGPTGVGGWGGMKKQGMEATVDYEGSVSWCYRTFIW